MRTFAHNTFLQLVVVLCWLATFAIGHNAFFQQDDILAVSLLGSLGSSMNFVIGLIAMLIPLGFFLSVKSSNLWFAALIIAYIIFCLLDVSRLTPYFICYLGLFLIFSLFKTDQKQLEKGLIILLVTVYLFSGLHKFNDQFADKILGLIWFHSLPFQPTQTIGYLVAASEMLFGIFLLFKKTRKLGCVFLIIMHAILLWKLSPFKWNWNPIVYPWNFAMIGVLVYLFRFSESFFNENLTQPLKTLAIIFFAVPVLSFVGVLPDNFGYRLYSGDWYAPEFEIDRNIECFKDYDKSMDDDETVLNPMFYSIQERALAISPDPWVFERIAKNIEIKYGVRVTIKSDDEKNKPSR